MIIDGKTISNYILADLLNRVDELDRDFNIQPHMAVVRVGEDPAISSYIAQKEKMAKKIGAIVSVYNFPDSVNQETLKESLDFLQTKTDIHGIILQLPVPAHIDYEKLILDIHPDKDVDGFRPNSGFVIPIANAVMKILEIPMIRETEKTGESFNDWLLSKEIVVMGKGKTGGLPIIELLRKRGLEPIVIDSQTPNPSIITKSADIVITAVGKPGTLTADMIKKDSILIGVGMGLNSEGKFVGDYNEEEIKDKAGWYTPIPGGVGPVNVACLMENLVTAAENSIKN
ncbi:MAG TPA: bifunctional 5,10-methylenetetrahydrofolate dehydrogenase/5,10-methenyltetrahydrofolate cyclohydrolase [Patescibacteria group bacterium]